jgi:prepilin peptidase CpaA
MNAAVTTAMGLALAVAATAALCDWRRGQIPNWVTLPPVVVAPLAYGLAFGVEHALHSLAATLLCAVVPYLLFRRGGMGGGDVKLFAALGAITGFDLLVGIEIELAALLVGVVVVCGALAWKGELLRTLFNALGQAFNPLLPVLWRQTPCEALTARVRMGGPILVATAGVTAPHLAAAWGEL